MFKLIQKDNEYTISIQDENNHIYQYVLLKNGENELRIPIENNEAKITVANLIQWHTEFTNKNIIVSLEYLAQLTNNDENGQNLIKIDESYYERRNRLLKPHRMNLVVEGLDSFKINDIEVNPFFNKEGFFVISFNKDVRVSNFYSNRKLQKIKISNKELSLRGTLAIRNFPLTALKLEIQSRSTSLSKYARVEPKFLQKIKTKRGFVYQYEVKVEALTEFKALLEEVYTEVDEDNWDLNWILEQKEVVQPSKIRCGMPKVIVEELMSGEISIRKGQTMHNFVPYFTLKGHNLSFFYNQYSNEEFTTYSSIVKKGKKKGKQKSGIWIIGEKQYKAQDNGLRFFEYMRTQHPEIEAYYVIREDSPERENVLPFGNVITYRSKEHFELIVKADYICGTHHPDSLYPNRSKRFTKLIKGKRVFLQHGVLGVKNIATIYGKKIKDFQTDLFITSSDLEKNIVLNDFDYEDYEVAVTGLPRFSKLFAQDIPVKQQILIIPTWRDWLTTKDRLLQSEYYERYSALINDPKLLALKEKGVDILFCLHPNMQQFTEYFHVPEEITVIHQGERLVQDLLKESALLITDYSSVAFDFSFLHKPVIYYQFDRENFLGKFPSHLDLDAMLPGVITDDGAQVVEEIWQSYNEQFTMSDHYKNLANQFIKHRDINASERIYEAILAIPDKKPLMDEIKNHQIYGAAKKKFRTNKNYFPTMRKLYKVMSKVLKKDPNLILFESNVGKQVSDSPFAIYEELIRTNVNYKYVWAYNGKISFENSNTKVIKRLSPEYFYYLAKAKFWINNQNFPSYLKKQKSQTYIQTWHGTPLKKMQNDVEHFEGKDSGYIHRVNAAVKQWDYLVSPSPYATKAFRSAFQFKKEILEVGYPRNDIFYAGKEQQQLRSEAVKKKYLIPENKKIILYAPTFRDDQVDSKNKHQFDLQLDLEKLKATLSEDYVLLIRAHVIVANNLTIPLDCRNFAFNVSKYNNIQDLYLAADICITDYSSVMFDFAHTKRPLLFYTYDLEHYKENLRGFYMDFEKEAPGPLLMNTEQLIHAVTNIDDVSTQYTEKYEAFYTKYCGLEDGHAASKIVQRFFTK